MWKKDKILVCLVLAEIVYLAINLILLVGSSRTELTFLTGEMDFVYDEADAVSLLEDGSFEISDGEDGDAWLIPYISLAAGHYRVKIHYQLERNSEHENCMILRSDSNLLHEEMGLHHGENIMERDISFVKEADDLSVVVFYDGQGSLSVKSITFTGVPVIYFMLRCLFFCLLLDVVYFLFFTKLPGICGSATFRLAILYLAGIVLFASFPATLDYLTKGHDMPFHINRITGIAEALRQGQFPVRIYTSAYNGYGYPCSVFYGDIFLYLPALLRLAGFPLSLVYRLYLVFVNTATCLIAFFCFTKIFRNWRIGVFGAFLYTCSAYRITNMYFRTALGEFSAMTFFPLLVYAAVLLVGDGYDKRERSRAWIWLSLGVSGVCQTHMISLQMCFLFWLFFMVLYVQKVFRKEPLRQMIMAGVSTVILNLWFLVPFLQYYMGGNYQINSGMPKRLAPSGLYLPQLLGIFFTGSGRDIPGSMKGEMPLTPGFALLMGLFCFLACCIRYGKREEDSRKIGKGAAILGIVALWLASVYCPWDWLLMFPDKIVRLLYSMQFPWRYLAVATVFLAVVSASAVHLTKALKGWQAAKGLLFLLFLCGGLPVGLFYVQYLDGVSGQSGVAYTDLELKMDDLYLPAGFDQNLPDNPQILCEDGIQAEFVADSGEKGVMRLACTNKYENSGTVIAPLIYYPNYAAEDADGNSLRVTCGGNGCVAVHIPPRFADTVSIAFKIPFLWRVCELISLAGWFVFLGVILNGNAFRCRRENVKGICIF